MKKLKIIFFPIGEHDTAGNKRLKNLAKYLYITGNSDVYFLYPYSDKLKRKSGSIFYLLKFVFLIIDLFRVLYILVRERRKRYLNFLYFYEGRHIMLHRIIAAKILGYKILIDLTENPNPLSYTKSKTQKARAIYFLCLYKIIPYYASGIVVVTKYLKNKIEKDFNYKVPVFLLTVTFDSDDFKVLSQPSDYPTIFYGGSYGNNYDFDSLFKAFNNIVPEFPKLKLVLSGKIGDDMLKQIKQQIVHKENLIFLGFLLEDQYYETICSMDILCMPRNNSIHANAGFPFKLAEYLATGKPVITSRVSDVSDYITDNDAFIYDPFDFKKLESFIRFILNNPDESLVVGKNGKLKAHKCFDAVNSSHDFYKFIANLDQQVQ
jgi:glycosyltransferase involved in cell wall biosynthesis